MGHTGGEDGYAVISYVLAGLLLYGGLGWLGDHFLHTNFLLPVGIIVGTVAAFYMIIKRYGHLASTAERSHDGMDESDPHGGR